MKGLLTGILFVSILGFGGFVYRNVLERPIQPVACPLDAKLCPDGTSVSREGLSCVFPACPPPSVSLANVGISFAVPEGFSDTALPDAESVAAYEIPVNAALSPATLIIRRYPIAASSTALATIQKTAIGGTSGLPVAITAYSSTVFGTHRFTVVSIERFEAVVVTAYYLARATDVLRFDAIDRDVLNWTDPNLNVTTLPAHAALIRLLTTLQGQ